MSETVVTFLASGLIWVVGGSLVVRWVADGLRHKEMIAAAVVAGAVAWLVAYIVKDLLDLPRPFMLNGREALTLSVGEDGSFPSGHVALVFAWAMVVWVRSKVWGGVYVAAAILVGVGRVLANVHYPIDVFGGAVIGGGVGWLVSRFSLKGWVRRMSSRRR